MAAKWDPLPATLTSVDDCPSQPGCNAAVLSYSSFLDNEYKKAHLSHHVIIRVFKPAGLDAASVRLPYVVGHSNIRNVEGRVIQVDGTVVELNPNDAIRQLVTKGRGYRRREVAFEMPGAEVGAYLLER